MEGFGYCKGLGRITIPGNIKNIAGDAFMECPSVEEIELTYLPLPWAPRADDGISRNLENALEYCCIRKESTSVVSRNANWEGELFGGKTIKLITD